MLSSLNKIDYKNMATLGENTKRSGYKLSHKGLTTLNMGSLVPIRAIPVVPGGTYSISPTMVARLLSPMLKPTMDDMYLDYSAFLCYDSQVWDSAHEFYTGVKTEDPTNDYNPTTELTLPKVNFPAGGWQKGTIADYLNLPILTGGTTNQVSALPFRHITNIFNNFFRPQSHQKAYIFDKGNTTLSGSNGSDYENDVQKGGMVPPVYKMHSWETAHLPKPQKGNPVSLSLTDTPVITKSTLVGVNDQTDSIFWKPINGANWTSNGIQRYAINSGSSGNTPRYGFVDLENTITASQNVAPVNLWADTSTQGVTINDLRLSITKQHILEKMARGGSRVKEYYKTFFGIDVPNLEIGIPEFLGGASINLETQQVVATNASTTNNPLGNIGGISHTTISGEGSFTKSTTQHGYIIIFAYIRQDHTNQNVIEKHWTRFQKLDHLLPELSNLGEQPTLNQEIYFSGTKAIDEATFGFNEVFSQYKNMSNFVTGQVRSKAPQTLDAYHYANAFTSTPTLTEYMKETKANLDRTIQFPSSVTDQFILSVYFDIKVYLPIPHTSGIPGIDRI